MDDKIYVLLDKDFGIYFSTVQVFAAHPPFLQHQEIDIHGLSCPRDIAACTETRHLYIGDGDSVCVWKVTSDGEIVGRIDLQSSYTRTVIPVDPWSLSVTSCRLLVTYSNQLLVFGKDGHSIKIIHLPLYMSARHAVETVCGTFIVCHCGCDFQDKEHTQVSEVDVKGCVIRYFDLYHGLQHFDGHDPVHLVLDSDGRVIVAVKHRIILLSSCLELERVLLSVESGSKITISPYRLCFVERTGHLLIAESFNCIKVFRVR
jgi:hypothetical protein